MSSQRVGTEGKPKRNVSPVFKFMLPLAAAAIMMFGIGKARAEDIGSFSAKSQSYADAAISLNNNSVYVGGKTSLPDSQTLSYGISYLRSEKRNTQSGSMKPADSCLASSQQSLRAGGSIIDQSAALTLDKVENNKAYFTLRESNIDTISGGGGTISVKETALEVLGGSLNSITVPSAYTAGKVFFVQVTSPDSAQQKATVNFSEWRANGRQTGGVVSQVLENKILVYLGNERNVGGDWVLTGRIGVAYIDRTLSVYTPIGPYNLSSPKSIFEILIALEKGFKDGRVRLTYETGISSDNSPDWSATFSGGYGALSADLRYTSSKLGGQFPGNSQEGVDSLSWTSEILSLRVSLVLGELYGVTFTTSALAEATRNDVSVEVNNKSTSILSKETFSSKTESVSYGASISADFFGKFLAEFEASGGNGNFGTRFGLGYTW
jgi:hypothetical protein